MCIGVDNAISPPPCVSSSRQPFSLLRAICSSNFLSGILIHSYTENEERGGNSLLQLLRSSPEVPGLKSGDLHPGLSSSRVSLSEQAQVSFFLQVVVFPIYWVSYVNAALKGVMRDTAWTSTRYLQYAQHLTFMISLNTHNNIMISFSIQATRFRKGR